MQACRTEAFRGHVAGCAKCDHQHIAYNRCKNRHCPKCQGPAARDWMAAQAEDLLPVAYVHVVFTLPAEIARIALWNKRALYSLLFKASAETVTTIAADPKRLGARIGRTRVLPTRGSALTHHPHTRRIVPGGGLSPVGPRCVACKPGFFLHVRVLSRLSRRLFLEGLKALHRAGELAFFGDLKHLTATEAFAEYLAPFRKTEWVAYAKPPLGGPEQVLGYLSRYTRRVVISNHRLATPEFIRRLLMHVHPDGVHRAGHYGVLASGVRKTNLAKIHALLRVPPCEPATARATDPEITPLTLRAPCPCGGGPMRIMEIFRSGQKPMSRAPPRKQNA